MVYTTAFSCITMIKDFIGCNNLINYKSFADYASFVTQKVAIEAIIVLVTGGVAVSDEEFEFVMPLVY